MSEQKQQNELIGTRAVRNSETAGGRSLTKIFINSDEAALVAEQLSEAVQNGEDGVVLTILQGDNKNGKPFAMIGVAGLEKREQSERPKKAFNADKPAPKAGGYKPKSPGYAPRGR